MGKLKYFIKSLQFLKVLNSPFKLFHIRFYMGKTSIGVPYFFPRRWRKFTEEEAISAAHKAMNDPNKIKQPLSKWVDEYRGFNKAVPIKVGFDYCGLGYKTKWTDTDFRYEWGPVFTFVFFGYQIALMVGQKDVSHYWEAWLYYEYATDKTKSKRERIVECRRDFPQTFTTHHSDWGSVTIDYYNRILKKKYLVN